MGTRSGQIDPGVLLYLLTTKRLGCRAARAVPLSGMRAEGPLRRQQRHARPARVRGARSPGSRVDYFVYRILRETGALAAAMGGIDGFVFTAGSAKTPRHPRARLRGLAWLGLEFDDAANARHGPRISTAEVARLGLGHSHRRGAHDRAPHACACRRGDARSATARSREETSMIDLASLPLLKGKKALVTGIANDQSIAWGCAKAFRLLGADLAITYLNEKAKPYVEPLAQSARRLDPHAARPSRRRAARGRLRDAAKGLGQPRFRAAFDRLRARRTTCRAASSTARRKASGSPWRCPAGRSSAWPSSRSR